MSDWENAPIKNVKESNIRAFADIGPSGYAGGGDYENPATNLKLIDKELSNRNLNPVARQALTVERAKMSAKADSGWEVAPKATSPSASGSGQPAADNGGWETAPKAKSETIPFKSGSAFEETGHLIPDMADAWKTFQKQWANRKNTPMTPEVMQKMMNDEKSVGAGVMDVVGGIPAMLAGGLHGVYESIKEGDATLGLKQAGETMSKFLPSTLLPEGLVGKDPTNTSGYKAAMAPVTALMDTLNAVPQGYGEILNAMGADKAAAQVTDAGKLGIMTAAGIGGAKGMMKGMKGQKLTAAQLEARSKKLLEEPVPEPTALESTMGHADDFGVINPYDVGGHVTRSEQGRPSVVDTPQRDLFGGEVLEAPRATMELGGEPIAPKPALEMPMVPDRLELVPKETPMAPPEAPVSPNIGTRDAARAKANEVAGMEQFQKNKEQTKQAQIEQAYAATERQKQMDYARIEGQVELDFHNAIENGMAHPEAVREAQAKAVERKAELEQQTARTQEELRKQYMEAKAPPTNAMAELFSKAAEKKAEVNKTKEAKAQRRAEEDAAYAEVARMKDGDFTRMEAEAQLKFAESIKDIEAGAGATRRAFLDRRNMDFQYLQDVTRDGTLMSKEHTRGMTEQLHKGDIPAALKAMETNHPSAMYRKLASYFADKMEGIKMQVFDAPELTMGNRKVTGFYDSKTNTVGLSGLGATSPHTLMHELSHALTTRFVETFPNDLRVKAINNLYKRVKGIEKAFPGIVNVKEFLAEAFSNPKFQEFLKKQRIDNRNMFTRFVDTVKNMLGLKTGDLATALDHAIDLGKQIVEASVEPGTKAHMQNVFKEAGLNNKLADLMAQKPRDIQPTTSSVKAVVEKLPGLEHAASDFAFYDKPMSEIIDMARKSADISDSLAERFAQQMQAGALFESLKTRNPVIKKTYEVITRAFQESALSVKRNLTDPETGLKAYMRKLDPDAKGEIWAKQQLVEGQRELSSMELANAGFTEAQIAYHNKYRELSAQFFKSINERREGLGMRAMDPRVSHIASRFMGDFAQMVYAWKKGADGIMTKKVVGRLAGNTKWELQRVEKHMKERHPDWEFGDFEYNSIGAGRSAKDRFAGMMEAINFLTKTDSSAKALMESYQGYLQTDAVNYLNATRHAKDKVKDAGGIAGSEGHKPWMDAVKNAEEGMKAQLEYFEQGYQWMAMEKAMRELKPMLGDEAIVKQTPNAVKYATKYVDHALGRNQGPLADAANWTASMLGNLSGQGHSNLLKLNNNVKHVIMQKFMGVGNIPFTITQLMQPLQTQPAMIRLMRGRGLEFSTANAQLKAVNTYMNSMLYEHGAAKLDAFEHSMVKYADEMGVFEVKMADHTKDINVSPIKEGWDKFADANIVIPEHVTRGNTFFFYSHMLKEAGIPVKDIFGAAENMTNMSMVNYHPIERPMGYAKLGWLGDAASTLSRYKHNQWSQLALYSREAIRADHGIKSVAPLATFLATSLAFGGAMGFFAFQDADAVYGELSERVLKKPDNLTNVVLKSNMPEVLSHGVFSVLGLDMTTRFSNANPIPDSVGAALMPYGSAVLDMAASTGRYALDPTSPTKAKQMFKSLAPQSVQGIMENKLFTEKSASGKDLYVNPNAGFNFGKGRVERTEGEQMLRNFGFRNTKESKELAQNYANGQIEKSHNTLVEKLLTKAKYSAMDDSLTPTRLGELAREAATHGESPDAFISQVVSWSMDRKLPQKQQQMLRNANKGFKGAFNIKEQRK